ncbi:MAG: HEAT repeat domain-containing protein, partial [Gammaproteobacteria bacterium]
VKSGAIGKLEVINLEKHPEIAQEMGVRTVPWVRIGEYELEGNYTPGELAKWAVKAASPEGMKDYFSELLNIGQIAKVYALITSHPGHVKHLFSLLSDPETALNVRVGIGALMEDLAVDGRLNDSITTLGELTRHENAQIRTDACHYLSLTGQADALPYIKNLLDDEDASVREIAEESLEAIINNQ